MKRFLLYTLLISLFITCKKDKDKNCTLSMSAAAGTYRITAVKYKQTPTSSEMDYYNTVFPNACERDDTYAFNANGTYVFTDAGTKCVPPDDFNGTWSISGNTITIDTESGNVDLFNCSSIVVSVSSVNVPGDKVTYTCLLYTSPSPRDS